MVTYTHPLVTPLRRAQPVVDSVCAGVVQGFPDSLRPTDKTTIKKRRKNVERNMHLQVSSNRAADAR